MNDVTLSSEQIANMAMDLTPDQQSTFQEMADDQKLVYWRFMIEGKQKERARLGFWNRLWNGIFGGVDV